LGEFVRNYFLFFINCSLKFQSNYINNILYSEFSREERKMQNIIEKWLWRSIVEGIRKEWRNLDHDRNEKPAERTFWSTVGALVVIALILLAIYFKFEDRLSGLSDSQKTFLILAVAVGIALIMAVADYAITGFRCVQDNSEVYEISLKLIELKKRAEAFSPDPVPSDLMAEIADIREELSDLLPESDLPVQPQY
jgi:hypothetical protein